MAFEGAPALAGEGQPRPTSLADESLVDLDVAGLLEQAHLLRQHRVGHLDVVPREAELDLAGREQQRGDGKANRMGEQVVQGVTRMAQRRKISQAATSSGMTPTSALRPQRQPGWGG